MNKTFIVIFSLFLFSCSGEGSHESITHEASSEFPAVPLNSTPANEVSPSSKDDNGLEPKRNQPALESSEPAKQNELTSNESFFPRQAYLTTAHFSEEIYLYSQPSENSQYKKYGSDGDLVEVLGVAEGNYYHYVKFNDSGEKGWIKSIFIEVEDKPKKSADDFPGLSEEQTDQLLEIDKNNIRNLRVKIVLPTYIPDGFKINHIMIDDPRTGYVVVYSDSKNNCFEISGASEIGAGVEDFEIVSVNSKALGKVDLGFTQYASVTNLPRIGFNQFTVPGVIPSLQQYAFWSPTNDNSCQVISLDEARKIVESLDYLNP